MSSPNSTGKMQTQEDVRVAEGESGRGDGGRGEALGPGNKGARLGGRQFKAGSARVARGGRIGNEVEVMR